MATPAVESSADNPAVPAMPFVVASWLGFSLEHIVAGLRRGSIAPPDGAPPDWLPPGAESLADADNGVEATTDEVPPADETPADLREAYAGLVRAIDPGVDDATFGALWASGGNDDPARTASLDALLWRTVGEAKPDTTGDGVDALAAAIARLTPHGTLVALGDEGSAALAQRARNDASALAALESQDTFSFVGRDAAAARFDAMTGARLVSDAWIDDRAKFVAWRAALGADPDAADGVATGCASIYSGATGTLIDRFFGEIGDRAPQDAADDAGDHRRGKNRAGRHQRQARALGQEHDEVARKAHLHSGISKRDQRDIAQRGRGEHKTQQREVRSASRVR